MKSRAFLAIIFAMLVSEQPCISEDSIGFSSYSKDGFLYENIIEYSRLMNMPDWSPDRGNAPLSAARAVEVAAKYLEEQQPTFTNATISSIALHQFVLPQYFKDKWYYNIQFLRVNRATITVSDFESVVVFMDGSIGEVSKRKLEVNKEMMKKNER